MEELREIIETEIKILSEGKAKDGDTMTVTVPFAQAGEKNQNGRTYPLALLKREVSRIQDAVKRHSLIGTGDHPAGGYSDIRTASHILQKVWLDEKGKGFATMKIIPTERGKAIMTLINHDAELGVSSRGYGTTDEKTGVVQNDYKLMGIDIVMNPSFKEGTFSKEDIYESVGFDEKDDKETDLMFGINPDFVEAMMKSVYGMQINEGSFSGSFEDFKKQKGNLVRAEILVSYDHFEDTESALRHLGAEEEIKRISSAPVSKKVTPDDVYLEAHMAGCSPKIYAEILNKNLEEKEKSDEVKSVRTEIERAGAISGRPKLVQREEIYPDGEKRMAWVSEEIESPQQTAERVKEQVKRQKEVLTEDEKAKIVAEKMGTTPEYVKEVWAVERKKKEEEKKRADKITSSVIEKTQAGFGSETRPDIRKRNRKIIEGE